LSAASATSAGRPGADFTREVRGIVETMWSKRRPLPSANNKLRPSGPNPTTGVDKWTRPPAAATCAAIRSHTIPLPPSGWAKRPTNVRWVDWSRPMAPSTAAPREKRLMRWAAKSASSSSQPIPHNFSL